MNGFELFKLFVIVNLWAVATGLLVKIFIIKRGRG